MELNMCTHQAEASTIPAPDLPRELNPVKEFHLFHFTTNQNSGLVLDAQYDTLFELTYSVYSIRSDFQSVNLGIVFNSVLNGHCTS